jgi:hypothetical protein
MNRLRVGCVRSKFPQLLVHRMQGRQRRTIAVPGHIQLPDHNQQHGHLPAEQHRKSQLPKRGVTPREREPHQRCATSEDPQAERQDQQRKSAAGLGW